MVQIRRSTSPAKRGGVGITVTAVACALALLVGQVPAGAATQVTGPGGAKLTVSPAASGSATFTDGTGYITATAGGNVRLDGLDYYGQDGVDDWGYPVGIYDVYGPHESDYLTNSGWYYAGAQWVTGSQLASASPVGSFTNRVIQITDTYTATPVHGDPPEQINCRWDYDEDTEWNVTNGRRKCYIQTFTAHGVTPSTPDRDLALIEVRWP